MGNQNKLSNNQIYQVKPQRTHTIRQNIPAIQYQTILCFTWIEEKKKEKKQKKDYPRQYTLIPSYVIYICSYKSMKFPFKNQSF